MYVYIYICISIVFFGYIVFDSVHNIYIYIHTVYIYIQYKYIYIYNIYICVYILADFSSCALELRSTNTPASATSIQLAMSLGS